MATLTRTMTYAELVAAISAGTLNKGESITISDYQTVHLIPNTEDINTGDVEPLLVTALSNNELKSEAYSVAFPDDVIYYCPDNDQSKVTGCTKGYIYRRVDTKQNNDFPFDFRQVKFRRWQISQPTYDVATEYSKGAVVKHTSNNTLWMSLMDGNTGNGLEEGANWRKFEWDNNSYVAWNPEYFPSDEVGWYLTPNSNYEDYKMFADNSYYDSAISNKIEAPNGNIIELCNTVIFGAGFYYNSIGVNFYYNSIGAGFNYNSIGAGFQQNTITDNFNNVSGSIIGVDFDAATHVYAQYTCTLFTRADGTPRLKYCNNSDVEVIVAANA